MGGIQKFRLKLFFTRCVERYGINPGANESVFGKNFVVNIFSFLMAYCIQQIKPTLAIKAKMS